MANISRTVPVTASAWNRTPIIDIRAEAEAINKIEDQWTAAILIKDIDKIMSIFASDAVAMNANTPACAGAQAIWESLEAWFADATILHNTFESAIDTIEISASGDLAYVRGPACSAIINLDNGKF